MTRVSVDETGAFVGPGARLMNLFDEYEWREFDRLRDLYLSVTNQGGTSGIAGNRGHVADHEALLLGVTQVAQGVSADRTQIRIAAEVASEIAALAEKAAWEKIEGLNVSAQEWAEFRNSYYDFHQCRRSSQSANGRRSALDGEISPAKARRLLANGQHYQRRQSAIDDGAFG